MRSRRRIARTVLTRLGFAIGRLRRPQPRVVLATTHLPQIGGNLRFIQEELAARTRKVLARAGYAQVNLEAGDGFYGWPEAAPFDAILVTAAAPAIPPLRLEQLKPGGRMVIPLGDDYVQSLYAIRRRADGTVDQRELFGVRFGPMLGAIQP